MEPNSMGMSRRTVLKSIGGGTSLAAIPIVSGRSTVDIPFLKTSNTVRKWVSVPKSWYEQNQLAHAVKDEHISIARNNNNITGIGVGISNKKYGGLWGRSIEFHVEDPTLVDLPSEIENVPITIRNSGKPKFGDATYTCYNGWDVNDIPGGMHVYGSHGYGTSCANAILDGQEHLLTAAHLFNQCDTGSLYGRDLSQGGDYVGEVEHVNGAEDWVLVNNYGSNKEFIPSIRDESSSVTLEGYVSESGTDYIASNDEKIWQMGTTTGNTEGWIRNSSYSNSFFGGDVDCVSYNNNAIYTLNFAGEGDSGGPFYYMNGGDAYLCGMFSIYLCPTGLCSHLDCNSDGTNENEAGDDSAGIAAYHLNDAHGMTFGKEWELYL